MKTVSTERLAEELRAFAGPEPRIVASGNMATPRVLLRTLEEAVERYRLFMLAAQAKLPEREGVIYETPFVGPGMRGGGRRLDYLPMRLSLVPRLFATMRPPDAVLLHTTVPRDGKVSLGIEVNILRAAIEQVRARGGLVAAQMNPKMPYTYGDAELAVEEVDYGVEVEEALQTPTVGAAQGHDEAIAERVAALIEDGATLQLGIGKVPDATLRAVRDRRELRIWSEMISDGVMALESEGALERDREIVCSFMFGSKELYEWVDGNRRIRMARTETANDPAKIASQRQMVSVNTALQVDLADQAGASHIGGRLYSGFGGQPDFVSGALHSAGGQAVIALRSWHEKSASSTIVPQLTQPVTSFQHSAVITEQGCAKVFGRSQRAQARLLIENTAHPDARERLSAQTDTLRTAPKDGAHRPVFPGQDQEAMSV